MPGASGLGGGRIASWGSWSVGVVSSRRQDKATTPESNMIVPRAMRPACDAERREVW